MHASIFFALCFTMAACAHGPRCDYKNSLGACSAELETVGYQVVVKAEQCSEVDVEVDGKVRTIRPRERGLYVADTGTLVDIKACRLYPEESGEQQ
jgi:hypothetical protein